MKKPDLSKVPEFYRRYVEPLPEADILSYMQAQTERFLAFLEQLPEDKRFYRYQSGKWSVSEMIGHILDAERVFAYRIMSIARGEKVALPGFDQDDYVVEGAFDRRDFDSMVTEFRGTRVANLALFESFTTKELTREGNANGTPIQADVVIFILVGHLDHHIHVLSEKYGL